MTRQWVDDLAIEAAQRVVEDFNVWGWLRGQLGFDPCDPALMAAGLHLGAVRGCDLNDGFWQVTGLPRSLARQADRAIVTLPVFAGGKAVEVFALDPIEPLYQRHLTDLVPVLPLGLGGAFFDVPARVRVHASLLNWLKSTAAELIAGGRYVFETGHVWVGDWRALDALPLREAIDLGQTAAYFDNDRQARAVQDLLRPPRPKLTLGVAA